jgi:hypothetical protein
VSAVEKLLVELQGQRKAAAQAHGLTVSVPTAVHDCLVSLAELLGVSKSSLASRLLIAAVEEASTKVAPKLFDDNLGGKYTKVTTEDVPATPPARRSTQVVARDVPATPPARRSTQVVAKDVPVTPPARRSGKAVGPASSPLTEAMPVPPPSAATPST